MIVLWFACVAQPKSVPVNNEPLPEDALTESSEPSEDTASELSDDERYHVGVFNAQAWSSSAQMLSIKAWYPSIEQGDSPYVYGWTGFQFAGRANENLTAACEGPRPLIVHSHGNASVNWELYPLHEHLAAQGYVVVAPDHPGNTFYANTSLTAALTVQRPQDIRDTVDWIFEQSTNPDHPLYGCVDPSAGYTVSGFSFGGYTAYVLAGALVNDALGEPTLDFKDSRVHSAMVYAPWTAFVLDDGTQALDVPIMSLNSAEDLTVGDDADVLFSSVISLPRALGRFTSGGHFTFVPQYCAFLPSNNGCGADNIDPDRAMMIIKSVTEAFMDDHHFEDSMSIDDTNEFSMQYWFE